MWALQPSFIGGNRVGNVPLGCYNDSDTSTRTCIVGLRRESLRKAERSPPQVLNTRKSERRRSPESPRPIEDPIDEVFYPPFVLAVGSNSYFGPPVTPGWRPQGLRLGSAR